MNDIENSDDENLHVIMSEDREYTVKSQVIARL